MKLKHYLIGIISVVLFVILDQITKLLAVTHLQQEPWILIESVFQLRYLENRGAAFGMLQNQQGFFLITGTLILIGSAYLYHKIPATKRFFWLRLCLVLIASGGIGNMIDRIRLNYVIDFLYVELINFPIFNVADIYVTVSMFLLILLILFYYKEEELDAIWSFGKKGVTHDGTN